jgi:hypothetical protein
MHMFKMLGALAVANLVVLQVKSRRDVVGADQQGLNLDAKVRWWWDRLPLDPAAICVIGALTFAGARAALRPLHQAGRGCPRTRSAPRVRRRSSACVDIG